MEHHPWILSPSVRWASSTPCSPASSGLLGTFLHPEIMRNRVVRLLEPTYPTCPHLGEGPLMWFDLDVICRVWWSGCAASWWLMLKPWIWGPEYLPHPPDSSYHSQTTDIPGILCGGPSPLRVTMVSSHHWQAQLATLLSLPHLGALAQVLSGQNITKQKSGSQL